MIIRGLVDEDFVNYKKPSMFIISPYCSFKCDEENGCSMCQNSKLAHEPTLDIAIPKMLERYSNNPITKSIVFGGLEPFDSAKDILDFIEFARDWCGIRDDIVIYTGYTEEELQNNNYYLNIIEYPNIVIKFGRFRPGQEPHFDEVLGVNLVSDNQYAKKINYEEV